MCVQTTTYPGFKEAETFGLLHCEEPTRWRVLSEPMCAFGWIKLTHPSNLALNCSKVILIGLSTGCPSHIACRIAPGFQSQIYFDSCLCQRAKRQKRCSMGQSAKRYERRYAHLSLMPQTREGPSQMYIICG